jgi:hypothetical protein
MHAGPGSGADVPGTGSLGRLRGGATGAPRGPVGGLRAEEFGVPLDQLLLRVVEIRREQ